MVRSQVRSVLRTLPWRRAAIALGVASLLVVPFGHPSPLRAANPPTPGTPSSPWRQYENPEDAGYSLEKLKESRELAEKEGSAAVLVVDRGHVLLAWGDVVRPFRCHSVRKSFLSALYGPFVDDGTIDLKTPLANLGIDDLDRLTPAEKKATIGDLLKSRSGVYHPAAKEVEGTDAGRPARGSHAPGTFFYYNNWDFNLLGVLFEKITGKKIFEEFRRRFAGPLGMEDYDLEWMGYELEPSRSLHPAYAFRMSARDAARFGWLFAQRGIWMDEPVLSESWVQASTAMHSDLGIGRGYGYCWWVYPKGSWGKDTNRSHLNQYDKFAAVGSGGHLVLVVPEAEFVFVHRADTDNGRRVGGGPIWILADKILAARDRPAKPQPPLIDLSPTPLPGAMPGPKKRKLISLDRKALEPLVGIYEVVPGIDIKVFLYRDRIFASLAGKEEGELFPETESRFFTPNPMVTVEFFRGETGGVDRLVVEIPGQTLTGKRVKGASAGG